MWLVVIISSRFNPICFYFFSLLVSSREVASFVFSCICGVEEVLFTGCLLNGGIGGGGIEVIDGREGSVPNGTGAASLGAIVIVVVVVEIFIEVVVVLVEVIVLVVFSVVMAPVISLW